MKRNSLWILFLFPGLVFSQAQDVPQAKPLVFNHVTVIDATGDPARRDMTVVITGDRITELGQSGEVSIPQDAQLVDAGGKFLIPGLWDMHVHTWYPDVQFLPLFISNGVTGVRDVHGSWEHFEQIKQWRRDITSGKIIGPRIVSAGPLVDGPKSRIGPQHIEVAGPGGGREAVHSLKNRGANLVKVYDWLSRDSYFAIVDEAKKEGMPYTGHVPFSVSAAEASDAGQDIEHLHGILLACSSREDEFMKKIAEGTWQPNDPDLLDSYSERKAEALFERFAKNGTWHTATMVTTWRNLKAYAGDDPDFMARHKYIPVSYKNKTHPIIELVPRLKRFEWTTNTLFHTSEELANYTRRFERYLEIVQAMSRAGVKFMTGTDTGAKPFLVPGFSLHDELGLLVEAGLTPMEALQAATRNPAEYLGLSDSLGTVEKGKIADLVLLDANPLEEIGNTRKISAVVSQGRFISQSSLQEMLANVEVSARGK